MSSCSWRRDQSNAHQGAPREASSQGGIVGRIVSLPRAMIGELSRVINHSRDLIGIRNNDRIRRRQQQILSNNNFTNFYPIQYPQVHDQDDPWAFFTVFEQQFGTSHPFFYACRFTDALEVAAKEGKLLFLYLHSRDHPFVASFCRDTLCSDLVVQFLDANFASWGGLVDTGEGLQMAATLRPATFPFCGVVAPAPHDNNITVLRQMEGPISPSELVEILQGTLEEQGLAFGRGRGGQDEKLKADRKLREEQDRAYLASLKIDKEKERQRITNSSQNGNRAPKPVKTSYNNEKQRIGYHPKKLDKSEVVSLSSQGKNSQILIRFPNGEKKEQSFGCTDKLQSVFRSIYRFRRPCGRRKLQACIQFISEESVWSGSNGDVSKRRWPLPNSYSLSRATLTPVQSSLLCSTIYICLVARYIHIHGLCSSIIYNLCESMKQPVIIYIGLVNIYLNCKDWFR